MEMFVKIRKAGITLVWLVTSLMYAGAQSYSYKPVKGFSDETNAQLEAFFDSTVPMKIRKVAVFDCDGTLFGQVPYYLADEALYEFAQKNYAGKSDKRSKEKMAIVDKLLHGNNVGVEYVQNRIQFLSGLTPEEIAEIGHVMFQEKYQNKMYPEMKQLLANLKDYDFEVWIVTASPEFLYEKFCAEQLGIPQERILGVKSLVTADGVTTGQLVYPVPQDNGKAEVVNTFIKTKPLFAGGNSRGDMELMNTSVGLKLIVNPDDKKVEKEMGNKTVKQYWDNDPRAITVYCNDVPEGDYQYVTGEWGVKKNVANAKTDKIVIGY
ncbi:HAD family phosphatase [Odoribacter sp. Z80]|uniref:HAD family hydrolase n=1 Tax=Odoribacter sp. Z80 TaxID=2304575 RepID=UPI00192A5E69|nr:haloacid dehalogenase-like hydrolase [Odoribacter sp. Z80]